MYLVPDKLYHIEIGVPAPLIKEALEIQKNIVEVMYSAHFLNRLRATDEKHPFTRIDIVKSLGKIKHSPITPFEIGTTEGKLTKMVIRIPFDNISDISVVLSISTENTIKVVTAWKNHKWDKHLTLDVTKYEQQ